MRKTLMGGLAAALATGVAGVAIAQTQPAATTSAKISPSKAGTKAKPKPVKMTLSLANGDHSLTAKQLTIYLPKNAKITPSKFKTCNDKTLEARGPKACPSKSILGTGIAHAYAGVNTSSPAFVTFVVTPVLTGKTAVGFYLQLKGGSITGLSRGKFSKASGLFGQKLTVQIPVTPAQQYPKGNYNGLADLTTTFNLYRGGRSLFAIDGCPSTKRHAFKTAIAFAPNPNPPSVSSVTASTSVACTK